MPRCTSATCAPLAGHGDVTLVVLNQADLLDPAGLAACLADLRRLLADDGLPGVPVLAVSALTGDGLDALRKELADRAAARRASVQRLEADLGRTAAALRPVCPAGARTGIRRQDRETLVDALTDAAGADTIAAAVDRAHRARAAAVTGWPFTRWLRRLRPDPMRRLRLPETPSEAIRTGLPGPSAVQRARVDSALRQLTARRHRRAARAVAASGAAGGHRRDRGPARPAGPYGRRHRPGRGPPAAVGAAGRVPAGGAGGGDRGRAGLAAGAARAGLAAASRSRRCRTSAGCRCPPCC